MTLHLTEVRQMTGDDVVRVMEQVVQDEREACARLCEEMSERLGDVNLWAAAAQIRHRSLTEAQ